MRNTRTSKTKALHTYRHTHVKHFIDRNFGHGDNRVSFKYIKIHEYKIYSAKCSISDTVYKCSAEFVIYS
jgi:hypothetical protein